MREMKDSGIAWIGEIPNDWKVGRIKYYVSKVGSGKTPKGDNNLYTEGNVLFLRSQNIYDTGIALDFPPTVITDAIDKEMSNTRVVKDDVLLNITGGSIGRCCIYNLNEKANVNQHVSIIRAKKNKMFPEYMHYFWISNLGQNAIQLYQTGGNREGMSAIAIKNTPIPVISLSEQKMIVDYLDSKCADIDSLAVDIQNQIEILKEYKKSVITQAVTKGIDPNVEMKDSGIAWIGKIPKSWKVNRLKNICATSVKDGTHQTPTYTDKDKGIPFLSSKDVIKGHIEWNGIKYIIPSLHRKLQKEVKPIKNDILLAKNGTTGVAAIVDTDVAFDVYVTLAVIRVNDKIVSPKYMLYVLNSLICKNQFNERLVGIGVPNLHLNIIKNTKIILPLIHEQYSIADFLDTKCADIDAAIAGKQKQLDVLKEYKKSLIYEYVTGKKEVPCRE